MEKMVQSFPEKALKDGELLEGIVEADEAYVLESQKGILVTIRKPRKHGEPLTKRGLSDEQMRICVATDREGRVVACCVNRAKPTSENIQEALGTRIGVRIPTAHILDELKFCIRVLVRVTVKAVRAICQGLERAVILLAPAVDVLSAGLVADSSLCDAIFDRILNYHLLKPHVLCNLIHSE